MNDSCGSIYKISRVNAGYSQKDTAEGIHSNERSISNYERGETNPPSDAVKDMMLLYKNNILGLLHLNKDPVGQMVLPKFSEEILANRDIRHGTLKVEKEIKDVFKRFDRLIEIVCDGIVDQEERKDCEEIKNELLEAAGATLELANML